VDALGGVLVVGAGMTRCLIIVATAVRGADRVAQEVVGRVVRQHVPVFTALWVDVQYSKETLPPPGIKNIKEARYNALV